MTGGFRGMRSTARLVPWIVLLGATLAAGEEFPLGTAPANPPQAGFAVTVWTERLGGEGFQPITLRFRATGPAFTRRRRLRVLLRPRNRYATHVDFQFSCGVTLPESAKSHDVRVLVPHIYRWETCSLHLIENGRPIDRRPTQLAIPAAAKDWGQHVSVGILLPRDAATSKQPWARFPDVRGLVTVLGDGPIPSDPAVRRHSDKEARDFVKQLQAGRTRFRLLEEDDLEASWLGYSQLDLILVPFPTLKRIETEQPQRMAELQKWLSTGTQIWTYGVSGRLPDWLGQTVPDAALASQFQADPSLRLRLAEVNDESPLQYQPWNFGSFYSGGTNNSGELRQSVYEKLQQARHPLAKTIDRKTFLAEVDAVRYGLGRVVLIGRASCRERVFRAV